MKSQSMEICKGFVQLHIHGAIGKTRLQGRNIHVHGYTLYSCGEVLCVYSNGKFYINMANKGKSATFKKHRDQITYAVCSEDSDLALYFRDENELKSRLQNGVSALSLKRKEIADILFPMLKNCVSSSYAQSIMDKILNAVVRDVDEAADPENWNDDDVRLACGRAILAKLRH